ncbi:LytR C-terminal domain-containing protein [Calidifontibacter terrae]
MQPRLALATLAVLVASSGVLTACSQDAKPKASASPSCPTTIATPTFKVALQQTYLNVYNASNKDGLASQVSSELSWRGAHVLKTGNDPNPDERPVPKAAEIRYGKNGRQVALNLAGAVQNAVLYQDSRTNPTVDLVLGNSFALVPVPPPAANKVTLNVYNTTFRTGLGGTIGGEMGARGFQIAKTGNDPRAQFLPDDTAIVRYGDHGEPAARRVALSVKGARLVKDGRTDTSVDLVLGSKFDALVPVAQATAAPTPTSTRPPGC